MNKNMHRGSSFDSFLEEEGILDEVKALAAKRTFVHQLETQMEKKHKKKNLFRQAFSSPATAERLFNDHIGISLETMARAAALLGCDLDIKLIPRKRI